MKLLFLSPRFPYPLDKGDRLTVYHYLRHLSQKHKITLVTFVKTKKELKYLKKVEPFCHQLLVLHHPPFISILKCFFTLFSNRPLQVNYYLSKQMARKIRSLVINNGFDMIYCHTMRMAEYVKGFSIPKVLALQISMTLNYRRLYRYTGNYFKRILYFIEYQKVKWYEPRLTRFFDKTLIISKVDQVELEREFNVNNFFLLPHGVDSDFFSPDKSIDKEKNSIIFRPRRGFVQKM